jgi:hypothetical protein
VYLPHPNNQLKRFAQSGSGSRLCGIRILAKLIYRKKPVTHNVFLLKPLRGTFILQVKLPPSRELFIHKISSFSLFLGPFWPAWKGITDPVESGSNPDMKHWIREMAIPKGIYKTT